MPSPLAVKVLVGVQLLMAAIAIPSGLLFAFDPSGAVLGGQFILPHLQAALPFIHDFTPVGIWLLVVYGALPIFLAIGLLRHLRWAWIGSFMMGITEVVWIAAELSMFHDLGFTPMYPLIGGIGVLACWLRCSLQQGLISPDDYLPDCLSAAGRIEVVCVRKINDSPLPPRRGGPTSDFSVHLEGRFCLRSQRRLPGDWNNVLNPGHPLRGAGWLLP